MGNIFVIRRLLPLFFRKGFPIFLFFTQLFVPAIDHKLTLQNKTVTLMIQPRQAFAAIIVFSRVISSTVTAQVLGPPQRISVGTNNLSSPWLTFVDVCVIIAPIASVMCSLAPIPTIVRIHLDKSVGKLPLLP